MLADAGLFASNSVGPLCDWNRHAGLDAPGNAGDTGERKSSAQDRGPILVSGRTGSNRAGRTVPRRRRGNTPYEILAAGKDACKGRRASRQLTTEVSCTSFFSI